MSPSMLPLLASPSDPLLLQVRQLIARADWRLQNASSNEEMSLALGEIALIWEPLTKAEREHGQLIHDTQVSPVSLVRRWISNAVSDQDAAYAVVQLTTLLHEAIVTAQQRHRLAVTLTATGQGAPRVEVHQRVLLGGYTPRHEDPDDA